MKLINHVSKSTCSQVHAVVSRLGLNCDNAHSLRLPGGEGNFQFGISANCKPGIPYFPAGYAPDSANPSFAIGMESSAVLAPGLKVSVSSVGRIVQANVI